MEVDGKERESNLEKGTFACHLNFCAGYGLCGNVDAANPTGV